MKKKGELRKVLKIKFADKTSADANFDGDFHRKIVKQNWVGGFRLRDSPISNKKNKKSEPPYKTATFYSEYRRIRRQSDIISVS